MSDNGARALAERLCASRAPTVEATADMFVDDECRALAAAILANGAVFLPADELGETELDRCARRLGVEVLARREDAAELDRLRAALRDIIVRCEEGDTRSNWLPIIVRIARAALQPEGSARDGG